MDEMTYEEFQELMQKMEENPLFKASESLHKYYQFRQFDENGKLKEGQIVRIEDAKGTISGEPGFDQSTSRPVIYNFTDGCLNSDGDNPAIQYEGHYEIWRMGIIEKVWAKGGKIIEYWEDGVPVKVDRF